MKFTLAPLPYAYDVLEPIIDAKTMEIHYSKHHQAYVNNLNAALEKYPALPEQSIEQLLNNLEKLPADIQGAVRNNGGGHFNHTMFWSLLIPEKNYQAPSESLLKRIQKDFGSFEAMKEQFSNAAKTRFGSGWAWLIVDATGTLKITSTPNQDVPFKEGKPILGLDVWEHAYYLNYQNRRPDYVSNFFKIINWKKVEENLR
ncbi:MAG: superoxide dismutase [Bacilli bacterium]